MSDSRIILLCGPAGSGKSHLAAQLREQGAGVYSIDEVAWSLGFHHHPMTPDQSARAHHILQQQVLAAVAQGTHGDIVVDASFWSRASRDRYRNLPYRRPVAVEVWYLDTPETILRARVARRTNAGPHDIALTQDTLTGFLENFEVPTPAEGRVRIITHPQADHPARKPSAPPNAHTRPTDGEPPPHG